MGLEGVLSVPNVGLLCLASATVAFGCVRERHAAKLLMSGSRGHSLLDGSGMTTLQKEAACAIPVMSSVALALMFAFLRASFYVLFVVVCGTAAYCMAFSLKPLVLLLLPAGKGPPTRQPQTAMMIRVPGVGVCPVVDGLLLLGTTATVCAWVSTGHWTLNNAIGIGYCVSALSCLRLPSLKVAVTLLCGLLAYDLFWVFGSEAVFGSNVMTKVATQRLPSLWVPVLNIQLAENLTLPMKLLFPARCPVSWSQLVAGPLSFLQVAAASSGGDSDRRASLTGGFVMIGLGDIVLPGLLVSLALRFDEHLSRRWLRPNSYFASTFLGYVVGLVVTVGMVHVYQAAQPALLYLVPCTLAALLWVSLWSPKQQLRTLWDGFEVDAITVDSRGK